MTRLLTTNRSHSIAMNDLLSATQLQNLSIKRHIRPGLKIQAQLRIAEASQVIRQKPLRVQNQTIVAVSTKANFRVNILLVVMTLTISSRHLPNHFNVQNYNITNQCSALLHYRFSLVFHVIAHEPRQNSLLDFRQCSNLPRSHRIGVNPFHLTDKVLVIFKLERI